MTEQVDPSDLERRNLLRDDTQFLVGRSSELGLLRAELHAALSGRGSLIILSGEAGIGKTSLAQNICHEAGKAGARILVGRCYDSAETSPYGPWIELLEQNRSAGERGAVSDASAEPSLTGSTSRAALFAEMRDFLFALARKNPYVILLDDVHWSDVESLDLLRFMARQISSEPILLIITYRNDEVGRGHPLHRLVPTLVREALAVRVDLSPLAIRDVAALIEHLYRLPSDDSLRLATYLQHRAEGNPFFVGELLRSLEGSVIKMAGDESWTLGPLEHTRVPVLLRQVIDQRLSRLGSDAEQLLEIAAVVGPVVPLALWAELGEATEEEVLQLVQQTVDAHIMDATEDGLAAQFSHALIREALYENMLPPRRRVLHRTIGETLVRLDVAPDPDEVAFHFLQGGDRRAVAWLTQAGDRAQHAFAWRTAAQRFAAALDVLQGDDNARNERGWLSFRVALLRRFDDPGTGIGNLEEAEQLGRATNDAALVAFARFYQGMLRCQLDDFRRGIAAEKAGIAMLDALTPDDHGRLAALATTSDPLDQQNGRGELTLALAGNGRVREALALGKRLISLPPEQTFGSRGDAFYGLGFAYASAGDPEAAEQAFSQAREVFIAADYRSMVTASLFDQLAVVYLPYRTDQPRERIGMEVELLESFAALNEVIDDQAARSAGIVSAILDGNWDEAFEIFDQSRLRFMRRALPPLLAPLARHRGNARLAWSLIREAYPAGAETAHEDSAMDALPLRMLAVDLALDDGDSSAARAWLESLDSWLDWSGSVLGQADAHLGWASYHQSVGEHELAMERARDAVAAAELPRQPLTLLSACRLLGLLHLDVGELDDAERQLTASLSLAQACEARHEQALTHLAIAELLLVRGDFDAARLRVETVRSLCYVINAVMTLAQAEAVEARASIAESAAKKTLPAGLTSREVEVLRLLASGLSNADIADRLSVSPRTINTHLTSIYGKLGVNTRGAAIRFALDHDLR